jgi:hypothetical protein
MDLIASLMTRVLAAPDDESVALAVRAEVEALCRTFPLYPHPMEWTPPAARHHRANGVRPL